MGKQNRFLDQLHMDTTSPFQLWDNGVAYTESCRGILDIGEGFIRLKLGKRAVTVWGDGLEVVSFQDGRLLLRGRIVRVDFDG